MPVPLGIAGATGRLGGRVARLLGAAGVEQRLVLRTPAEAPELLGSTVAQASYADRDAVRRALEGIDTVLMVSAAETEHRVAEHRAFVDAAAAAGVEHLVYVSFCGASADATFTLARDHHATEQHIEQSGMAWTFVRDNLYADFFVVMAGADGVIRGPAGEGRVSAVAEDDIAVAVTAVLLAAPAHRGRTYSLTGPEALTLTEAASTMSRVLGRSYEFVDETVAQAYASRAGYDAPGWQLDAWVSTYTAIASGELAGVTDDVRRLTGHPPRSLADLLGSLA